MIAENFDIRPTLIKGKDGVFEISLDGELIFSKKVLGRFPEPGEVEQELRQRLA